MDQQKDDASGDLLRRWQDQGDLDALDEILRGEVRVLKDLVAARGRDLVSGSASASDIAQETVLRLLQLETVPHFSDPEKLRGYLWITAWRLMLQRIRRPYRRKKSLDTAASSHLPPELVFMPGADAETEEARSALDLAMNLLSAEERDVLHRVYFEGHKIADIARESGVTESAVKMRLMRARRSLAGRLAAWADVVG